MGEHKPDLFSLAPDELESFVISAGYPPYRSGQIFSWIHGKQTANPNLMTNLPADLRGKLGENFQTSGVNIKKRLASSIDGTVKYLYELSGGEMVEGVLMHHKHGRSLCISSQVGCRMACGFCASALGGLSRNLTAGEMLWQVYSAAADVSPVKISSVVLMGVGEPLDNFESVCRFLELLSHPEGFGLSLRRVSLSTCGLVDGIYKLAEKKYPLTLSVSLHAPNDELRSRLMPVNRLYDIASLMQACRDYFAATGRRVSFEYALIDGQNDKPEHAAQLADLLDGMSCHINLIPLNKVEGKGLCRSSRRNTQLFRDELAKLGRLSVTIRRELGSDLEAACGQLRRRESV